DRAADGEQRGQPQGDWLGNPDDPVLHQPRREKLARIATEGAGTGEADPSAAAGAGAEGRVAMIRKLPSGGYRLYSRKVNPATGKRRNLGTFGSLAAAKKHERAVQFFK